MSIAVLAVSAVLALSATVPAVAASDGATSVRTVCSLQDRRIDEASGLGVGIRSPGVDYVQNDSGDVNRFFALDAATGATAAVVTVPGARNVDWEDLAVAPAADGTPSVWLADTGDNDDVRREVEVYRVPEPRIRPGQRDRQVRSARPDVWRLRYPSGATDTESLAVTPQGRAYLVTKSYLGGSVVYRLPLRPRQGRLQTLTQVGAIRFRAHDTGNRLGTLATVAATSASISANGALLVVRTYTDAYVWRIGTSGVAAALRQTPTRIALPDQPQGEGIAFAGRRLLVDSEGVGTAVDAVPLPARLASVAAADTAAGASATAGPSTAGTSTSVPARQRRTDRAGRSSPLTIIVVLALFGAVIYLGRRARRTMGS